MWLRGKDLNLRPLGYAYHDSFRCLDEPVRGLDFLFTLGPALPPLGCLPLSLYTFSESLTAFKAWLGVTPLTASPNLTGCRTEVSFCAAQCRIRCQASRTTRCNPGATGPRRNEVFADACELYPHIQSCGLSPTSYQTAPPRGGILTKGIGQVKARCVGSVPRLSRQTQ